MFNASIGRVGLKRQHIVNTGLVSTHSYYYFYNYWHICRGPARLLYYYLRAQGHSQTLGAANESGGGWETMIFLEEGPATLRPIRHISVLP